MSKTPAVLVFGFYLSGFAGSFAIGCGTNSSTQTTAFDSGAIFGPGEVPADSAATVDPLEVPWYAEPGIDLGNENAQDTTQTEHQGTTGDTDLSTNPPCYPHLPQCDFFDALPNKLKYPLVFAHGAGGFEKIGPYSYFYFIPETLIQNGFAAYVAALDPFNTSAVRGLQLAEFVDGVLACTCAEKVSIIAHSQGGLDARYMVSTLGYADRVASITTIATPHHGTAIADIVLGIMPGFTEEIVNFVLWFVGNLYTDPVHEPEFLLSMEQFSTTGARRFNAENPDAPGVTIYSWAGRAGLTSWGHSQCEHSEVDNPPWTAPVSATLAATWTALGGTLGVANDGMVTVDSAKWGRFRGCIAADHLAEVGQVGGMTGGFAYLSFYLALAEFLFSEGF